MVGSLSVNLVALVVWLRRHRLSVYQDIVRNPRRLPGCLEYREDIGTVEKGLHESNDMFQRGEFRRGGDALAAP